MKKWIISSMDTKPSQDNLENVVVTIHWRRVATEVVDEKEYVKDVYGAYSCPEASADNFVSYESLTKEEVEGWLNSGLNVEEMDQNLDKLIEDMVNPPIVSLPLPFEN